MGFYKNFFGKITGEIVEEEPIIDDEGNAIRAFPSCASSSISPAASAVSFKMDMSYFDTIEERLGIQEEEFFKKEDFDIEE